MHADGSILYIETYACLFLSYMSALLDEMDGSGGDGDR